MFDFAPKGGLSQGDLVASLSAHGYEGSETYGLVITARCDFAHDKADVINYVPVVSLANWFNQTGWRSPASQEEKQVAKQLVAEAMTCLRRVEIETSEIRVSVTDYGGQATIKLIEQCSGTVSDKAKTLAARLDILRECLDRKVRASEINEKLVGNMLGTLQSHGLADLYYLPLSFLANANANDEAQCAHVALLRQIYAIPTTNLEPENGVAAVRLRSNPSNPISQMPPLSTTTSIPFGRVARLISPYTEHFLQRLTLLFARVGVNDIRFENIEKLTKAIR